MTHKIGKLSVLGICLVLVAVFIGISCKERDVPFIIDEEEIERFIVESNQGRQFFGIENLITVDTFSVPNEPGVTYKIVLDSVKRNIDAYADTRYKHFGFSFLAGEAVRDGEAFVADRLHLRLIAVSGLDTVITPLQTTLSRRGWFVKLGDDSHQYAGWLLYGFNGSFLADGGSVSQAMLTIEAPGAYFVDDGSGSNATRFGFTIADNSGESGQTTYSYKLITDTTEFLKIPAGTNLILRGTGANIAMSKFMLASFPQLEEIATEVFPREGGAYQLSFNVPSTSPSAWYTVISLEVRDASIVRCSCVPYRIWPAYNKNAAHNTARRVVSYLRC